MPHSKFKDNQASSSRDENICGRGGHQGHVTNIIFIILCPPFLKRFHIKFGLDWLNGVREDVRT